MDKMPKWSYELKNEIITLVQNKDAQQTFLDDLDLWISLRSSYVATKSKSSKSTRKPLDKATKEKLSKALINRPKPFNYKQVVYDGVIYPSIKHCIQVTGLPRTTLWRHLNSWRHQDCYYVTN